MVVVTKTAITLEQLKLPKGLCVNILYYISSYYISDIDGDGDGAGSDDSDGDGDG